MVDVTCYAQAGKAKSEKLCEAFAAGVRANGGSAHVFAGDARELRPGAAVFYGVRPHQRTLLDQAKAQGRDWWYIDNAYFDSTRERYFRVTRNRLQHLGTGDSDGKRFAALNIGQTAWRKSGKHVLVCPQSDEFMLTFSIEGLRWKTETVARLKRLTTREIRVRPWQSNKVEWYKSLPEDLRDCWALVTYSSASAITAMLDGVPAFVSAQDCISRVVSGTDIDFIEQPTYHDNLLPWCNVVADHQFSVEEIANGHAWARLHEAVDGGL